MQLKNKISDDFAVGLLIQCFHPEWYSFMLH